MVERSSSAGARSLRIASRGLAVMLVAVIIDRATMLRPLISPGTSGLDVVALVGVWLAILLISVVAGWRARPWLVIPFTVLAGMSTVVLAIPLVPFVWRAMTPEERPMAMLVLNALVVLVAGALAIALRRRGSGDDPGLARR